MMEDPGSRVWKIVVLTCAALLIAGAAALILWAASGGNGGPETDGETGAASQESADTQPPGDDEAEHEPQGDGGKTGGGQKSGTADQQPDTSEKSGSVGTQVLPIPASSVDEALLTQAVMDYVRSFAGTTEGFSIVDIKFSDIDPRWARVVIAQKHGGMDMSYPVYFYYQGDRWVPEPVGPGTPAIPTDI